MKKVLVLLTILILSVFISCSGLLWNGTPDYSGERLIISIDNPFYQGEAGAMPTQRALALQGKFLYIELARIDDQALYNADTDKLVSGNGVWAETAWGGHAILTFNLNTWTETLEATFKDVPRDQSLKARALLDVGETELVDGIQGYYGEGNPICMTYDPSAPDLFGDVGVNDRLDFMWITIPSSDLVLGFLSLPIRPEYINTVTWGTSSNIYDDYMSASLTDPGTEVQSNFYLIEPDIASFQLRNMAIYAAVDGEWTSIDVRPPHFVSLFNNSGSPVVETVPVVDIISVPHTFKSLQIDVISLPDYSSPDYFFGSNLLYTISDGVYSSSSKWDVSFGILYDDGLIADDGANSDFFVSGSIPTGLDQTDLEFRILNIASGPLLQDIDTIDKIYTYATLYDSNWDSSSISWVSLNFTYSELVFSPAVGSWIIVIAKTTGGEEFIFGRTQFVLL